MDTVAGSTQLGDLDPYTCYPMMLRMRCLWVLIILVLMEAGCARTYSPSGIPPPRPKTYLLEVTLLQSVRVPFRLQILTEPIEGGQMPKAWLLNSYLKSPIPGLRGQGDTVVYTLSPTSELRLRFAAKGAAGWFVRRDVSGKSWRLPVHGQLGVIPILAPSRMLVGCANLSYQQLALVKESAADRLWRDSTQTYTLRFPPDTSAHPMFLSIRRASRKRLMVRGGIQIGGVDYDYLEGELLGNRLWMSYFNEGHIVYLTCDFENGACKNGLAYTLPLGARPWSAKLTP